MGPGDAVVVPTPTFPMFAVEAALAGGRVVAVPRAPLRERPSVDANPGRRGVVVGAPRLDLLPNNPTGDLTALAEIEAIADGLPALVVVDEVYVELAEAAAGVAPAACRPFHSSTACPTSSSCAPSRRRTASAGRGSDASWRTMRSRSGSTGLASACDGRAEQPPGARRARRPGSSPGAPRGPRHRARTRLDAAFDGLGWERLPSVANFVLFRPPDAAALAGHLHRRGIVLRAYGDGPLSGWLRVTVRSPTENDRFLAAIRAD